MMTVALEDPRAPDNAALVKALDALMVELYDADMCHLASVDELARAEVDFFVAREAGEALGCGALRPTDEGVGEIKRMWTRPEARGRGVARALLSAIEARASERGFSALRLETGDKQEPAIALYRKCGFIERGPYAGKSAAEAHLFMEKFLTVEEKRA